MSKKKRTRPSFTAEQKAATLRQHLVDKVAVSELCEEHGLQPSVCYTWHRQLIDNLAPAIEHISGGNRKPSRETELERRVAGLEAKLAKKDAVIAEISEEYVTLEKARGGP